MEYEMASQHSVNDAPHKMVKPDTHITHKTHMSEGRKETKTEQTERRANSLSLAKIAPVWLRLVWNKVPSMHQAKHQHSTQCRKQWIVEAY